MPGGYPVVLTADRTLIADYRLLFEGMVVAGLTTATPRWLLNTLLMPRAREHAGRAAVAPLGLRRIEAALRQGGFTAAEVAVVTPESVGEAIGPATRVVGICSGEPCGLGMNTSTMTAIAGGTIFPEAMFRLLLRDVRAAVAAAGASARIVLGGPGAWQLAASTEHSYALGIDHVVTGYAEGNAARIMSTLVEGDVLPRLIAGEGVSAEAIPPILGAATMGAVEISRGCGLGCGFCTLGQTPMRHLTDDQILADVRTNLAGGKTSVALLCEDFFRFGGQGTAVEPGAVLQLLSRLRALPGLRLIQIDHANVISVARYTDAELSAVHDILVRGQHHGYPWVNLGVETASGDLLLANGGKAKMGQQAADAWGALCAEQVQRLCRAGFFPMVSLIIGMPGEREDDVRRTLAWVESLAHERLSVFPVVHAPIDGSERNSSLSKCQWELIRACYRLNFRWIPRMFSDNQRGAGVSSLRRLLPQLLGYGKVLQWNGVFTREIARAREIAVP